ncbi:hypothetical protein JCM10450v2_002463 [Rhodotorula kratochvilovae]
MARTARKQPKARSAKSVPQPEQTGEPASQKEAPGALPGALSSIGDYNVPSPKPSRVLLPVKAGAVVVNGVVCDVPRKGGPSVSLVITSAGLELFEQSAAADDGDALSVVIRAASLRSLKIEIHRWEHAEGSDVSLCFVGTVQGADTSVIAHLDTLHESYFDPDALELAKLLFRSWQQQHPSLLADIPRTRALAIPLPGESLAYRVPLPAGYDPHDSSTWVAPFVDPPPVRGKAPARAVPAADNEAAAAAQAEGSPRPAKRARTATAPPRETSLPKASAEEQHAAMRDAIQQAIAEAKARFQAYARQSTSDLEDEADDEPVYYGTRRAPEIDYSAYTSSDLGRAIADAQARLRARAANCAQAAREEKAALEAEEPVYSVTGRVRRKTTMRSSYRDLFASLEDEDAGLSSENERAARAAPRSPKSPRKRKPSASATPGPSTSRGGASAAPTSYAEPLAAAGADVAHERPPRKASRKRTASASAAPGPSKRRRSSAAVSTAAPPTAAAAGSPALPASGLPPLPSTSSGLGVGLAPGPSTDAPGPAPAPAPAGVVTRADYMRLHAYVHDLGERHGAMANQIGGAGGHAERLGALEGRVGALERGEAVRLDGDGLAERVVRAEGRAAKLAEELEQEREERERVEGEVKALREVVEGLKARLG